MNKEIISTCTSCNGTGKYIWSERVSAYDTEIHTEVCGSCLGSGKIVTVTEIKISHYPLPRYIELLEEEKNGKKSKKDKS